MPLVVFESTGPRARESIEVSAPGGGPLIDLCDERSAPVPFSCRSASCGTCRVVVVEGRELLDPPSEEELDVLDAFGDDPGEIRLACQARLRPGTGVVRIRAAG